MHPIKFLPVLILFALCYSCQQAPGQHKQNADAVIYTYKAPRPGGTGKCYKGREIANVMGFSGAEWLERDTRQQEENVAMAIKFLPIESNSIVADIGAGTGYYTFRIAPRVARGKIYAVELQNDAINFLKQRGLTLKYNNVIVIQGAEKAPNLPDNSIDVAFMVDVYHELLYPQEYLQSLRKVLRNNGKLILIEYRGEDPDIAIKELHKTTVAQLNKELMANGYIYVDDKKGLPIQHFLIYQKK